MSRVGAIALARPTFDVEYAQEVVAAAFEVLDAVAPGFAGSRELLFDASATQAAIDDLRTADIDTLLILQVTFTDASMTKKIAEQVQTPVAFWAFPEDRTGGRLRLNSLCGINLAAYALRADGHDLRYLYLRADDAAAPAELERLLEGTETPLSTTAALPVAPGGDAISRARAVAHAMAGATTGVIGDHPEGFDPCAYDVRAVRQLTGVTVQRLELGDLFAAAEAAPDSDVAAARARAERALGELSDLEQPALQRSLRIYCGLVSLSTEHSWTGFATRCWPECFTEYGSAACAPQAMMTDGGIPGGCEADAYGTLTSLILRELAGEPPFVADLVDIDTASDSAVFWHCGVAPLSMADPKSSPRPTVHSNRRKPLLHEFPLKPGQVTIARLSQSQKQHRLVIGGGEMLRAPLPFSGTAGVVRFDRPAGDVLATVMAEGLEHHYGLAYGDYREELHALADHWGIETVALT